MILGFFCVLITSKGNTPKYFHFLVVIIIVNPSGFFGIGYIFVVSSEVR